MIWLRRGVVFLLVLVLFASLVEGVSALTFNRNLGQATKIEVLLKQSGVYDKALASALQNSQKESDQNGSSDVTISLDDPIVQQAAQQVFTPQLIEQNVNTLIDANYAWLNGKTKTPMFMINLSSSKEDFATRVGKLVQTRLAGLPVCTAAQITQLQIPVSSLTVTCRPPGLDPATEGARVAQEIRSSDFLTKPVITASTLGRDDPSQGKAYYEKLSQAPKLFQLSQKLPIISGVIALLATIGIIFIAPKRRKGWLYVGLVLLVSGGLLAGTRLSANATADQITKHIHDTVSSQLKQPRDDFVHHLATELTKINLWFGAAFLVLAITIFITLLVTRNRQPKAPSSPESVQQPRPQPTTTGQPKPPITPASGPPKLKKPPRPPRLIQ
ncbi:MAG TPA: hypothetical protein VK534_01060 [Methylomirabilota bacterium]|nr:hypothetical protein [Methylomirabilota bacterium]